MEHVQHLSAGTSTAWPATGSLTAPQTSAKTIKTGSMEGDPGGEVDSAGQTVPRQPGTLVSDKLARIFMRSKSMDVGSETRSLISDCETHWLSRTLIAHNSVVPKLADSVLMTVQGDMTRAFAFAAAMGDSCIASVFFEAGADTVQVAKSFIDRGEWNTVKFIIQERLFRFSSENGGISDVMAYALESHNVPSMDWLKWLCDDVPSAGDLVAAHFGQKRDLVALMEMARSQSIVSGPLIKAVADMPGLSRDERISAIRKIVDWEEVPDYGTRASEHALHDQLVQSDLKAAELMIAGGVRWNHALFLAAFHDDVSTIKNLFKCDGIQQRDVIDAMLSRPSPLGQNAIVYSVIQHYALEGHLSPSLKIRELKELLNARPEIKGFFRDIAEIVLRSEIQAGNTHAVAILMAAGVTLDDINDLDWLTDPLRTTGAKQQVDAHSAPSNTVKPSKQFV